MTEGFFYAAVVACLFTAVVLMVGVLAFGLGRSNPTFSNRMMRLRIIGQFVAVVLIMATILAMQAS